MGAGSLRKDKLMIARSVLMEGNQIYRFHYVRQISHVLRGGRTIVEVE